MPERRPAPARSATKAGGPLALLLLSTVSPLASGALPDPGFWDVSQAELDRLVRESEPYLRDVAQMGNGARRCNRLPGYEVESAYKLTNATVLVVDEDLLCMDFSETCELSKGERDEWLLERAGWFSSKHIATGLNDIPHDPRLAKDARRACAGGRALLIPVNANNGKTDAAEGDAVAAAPPPLEWVDVKGVGSKDPKPHSEALGYDHGDGLFPLFDALYEYLNEKTVAAALGHHTRRLGPGREEESFHTVGIYAVLALGFQYPWETESAGTFQYAAGAVVRQSSRRHPNPHGWMATGEAEILEQILNSYGIRSDTSVNDEKFRAARLPNPTCRRINLQGTVKPRTLTDFGNVHGDSSPWPPGDDECLVNWGQTARIVDAPLWRREEEDAMDGGRGGIGSAKVRDFLREREFNSEVPPTTRRGRGPWPARKTSNARMHRVWEAADCWWDGRCGEDRIREAIAEGLIDRLLLVDGDGGEKGHSENATTECYARNSPSEP